jgi:putative DNA-invertase from lambdoid prophage Rac
MNALYVRTSTSDQDGQAQLHALRRATDARGWTVAREFLDLGHSGAKASRPALDELRRAAKAGEVRAVMIVGLDRLGRSLRELLVLLDELNAAGCAVISLREAIDLTTPTGRLLVHLIAALAEFERELIRERVRAGIARVRATGKTRSGRPIGRPLSGRLRPSGPYLMTAG